MDSSIEKHNIMNTGYKKKTMIELIDLYRYKVTDWVKNGSEMDFVIRI